MKKLFLLTAVMLISCAVIAQKKFQVSGTVKDSKNEALSFANVYFYKSADSTLYKALAADIDGKFTFEDSESNSYYLKISSIGYEDFLSPGFVLNAENPSVSFPFITLKENATVLEGVQVTAKKPFIEHHLDKMVLNVENSISGSGSTALEILEKAPGVIVDRQNDQIRIRNKAGVVVMIDGKINYMSSEALAQYLSNMPSDQIESIEIITNPSSKYDAAGNSGIINIKLKKNKAHGTNGTLSMSGGTGILENSTNDLFRGNANLTLNHRNAKWNYFGNAGSGRSRFYNDNHFLRSMTTGNTRTDFDQYTQRMGGGMFYYAKGGTDYSITDKTTIGLQGDFNIWNGAMNSKGTTHLNTITNGEALHSYLLPRSERTMGNQNYSGNFSVRHKEDEKEISFDLDYSGYRNNSDQTYTNEYFNSSDVLDSTTRQRVNQPTIIDIYSAKLDFTLPFENKVKLDFGAKTSFVTAHNDFTFEDQKSDAWIINPNRSNLFKYREFVNAVYANTGYQKDKWSFQVGLRAEQTIADGHSVTLNQRNKRNYVNLFPTGFFNYKLSENHAVKYSYSRRIDRPNYGNLNPFVFILDPYFYVEGNPYLNPQFTNSNEFTYTFKGEYSGTLAYSDTKQMISEVITQDLVSGITISQMQNLARLQSLSATFSAPYTIKKWWVTQSNLSLNYNQYTDPNLGGNTINNRGLMTNFSTTHTFTLPKQWSAELNAWYYSPGVYGIFRMTKAQYAINPGIQKTFWDKKAKLKLNVNDLFLTSLFQGIAQNGDLNMNISNRWNARRVALTFTYNFGNQNVKGARESSGAADAKKRAGGEG